MGEGKASRGKAAAFVLVHYLPMAVIVHALVTSALSVNALDGNVSECLLHEKGTFLAAHAVTALGVIAAFAVPHAILGRPTLKATLASWPLLALVFLMAYATSCEV